LDPDYAHVYVGLAFGLVQLGLEHFNRPPKEAFPKAKNYINKALEIDDSLAEAHAVKAMIVYIFDWDWEKADYHFKIAKKLNDRVYNIHYGHYLTALGRYEECMIETEIAVTTDPVSWVNYTAGGFQNYCSGNFNKAIEYHKRAIKLQPNNAISYAVACLTFAEVGMKEEVNKFAKKYFNLEPDINADVAYVGNALGVSGYTKEAEQIIEKLLSNTSKSHVSAALAIMYSTLGDKDKAFNWLQKAFEERSRIVLYIKCPFFKNIHNDSRYLSILKEMGLP
jgi:Tfp pilus assembly protein PilF